MPRAERLKLNTEGDSLVIVIGRARGVLDAQHQAAVEALCARSLLIVIRVLDCVVEIEFTCSVRFAPLAPDLALLLPLPFGLVNVGEVRVHFERESEGRPLLREICEVNIFVEAVADVTRKSQFKRLL